jgi:hypothetical protein
MWPTRGSQFSFFGWKASPYFASTSGVSRMSGSRSSRSVTRSMDACTETKSAKMRASCWIGSKMPSE